MTPASTTKQMVFVAWLMVEGLLLLGAVFEEGRLFLALAGCCGVVLAVSLKRALDEVRTAKQQRAASRNLDHIGSISEVTNDVVIRVRAENKAAAERDQSTRLANAAQMSDSFRRNAALGDVLNPKQRSERQSNKRLARIWFTYIDLEGALSEREVNVVAVDAGRFEGYCLKARGTRTFNIAGVQGDVLDLDTGELIAPARWAKALKKSSGGGKFNAVSIQHQTRARTARKPAIHFTGFRQAEKEALEAQADAAGLYVAGSVVKDLRYLVVGPTQSKKKITDAEAIGAEVLDRDQFSMRF